MFTTIPEIKVALREHLDEAVALTLADLLEGDIKQEPSITERLSTRIADSINKLVTPGVKFHAVSFTDRGPNSEESRFGADFAGFFVIDLPNRSERKFFLAQAKIGAYQNGKVTLGNLTNREIDRLLSQLSDMVRISNQSYLAIYTPSAIEFVPALSILQAHSQSNDFWNTLPNYAPSLCVPTFYTMNFNCYIGDMKALGRVPFLVDDVDSLKRAMDILRIRTGQLFRVISLPATMP